MTASVQIDGAEFSRLMNGAKSFDKTLARRLRRNIRDVAKVASEDVKKTVLLDPPDDRPGSVGTRAGIARGIRVRISTGAKGGEVAIVGGARMLPANRKPMARLYNKAAWRHPTFGNKKNWQVQQGRPYFGSVILKHRDDLKVAIVRAMDEAANELARKI